MFDTVIADAITRNEVSRRRENISIFLSISYQNMKMEIFRFIPIYIQNSLTRVNRV
jgi:hypothetical protein